jgi:peptidyl-prolyl cis-trans isomerase SurA
MILKNINNIIMRKPFLIFLTVFIFSFVGRLNAQNIVIDQVVAVIGSKAILLSDIENEYLQYIAQGMIPKESVKCDLLEELMFQNLLLNQAMIDSVTVGDAQVEAEMNRRLRYFIDQIGSQEKLEAYFNKTILEIKSDMRESIKDMLITQTMQSKITEKVKITPSEVLNFFQSLPKDSLPLIESELEIGKISKIVPISEAEKNLIKEKLNSIRDRILKGEDFATLAKLYSEDPGSFKKGGELGFYGRGELYPEFEAIAFGLKDKEVSPVIETKAGFHIIQLIERRGEQINVRHILLQPKVASDAMYKTKLAMDSVADLINKGLITFENAALKYSEDPSKTNNGIIVNPQTNSSAFKTNELKEINESVFFIVDPLKVGEISKSVLLKNQDDKQEYCILYVKSRTTPHKANLKEDYSFIQNMALSKKQNDAFIKWIKNKKDATYINIMEPYKNCTFKYDWKK